MGSPSAKEGSSAKYEHTSKFTLASQKVFLYILYERSNNFGVIIFKKSILILVGGSLSKEDWSARFDVAVFQAYILDSLGVPLAKVGSSANFGVLVFKASMLYFLEVYLPKYVCLPSLVYKYSRHLCSINWGVHWPKKLTNVNTLLDYF